MNTGYPMDQQSPDYAVGYAKPPVESRFQKGQSGNPGGRARRTKTLVALLGEALSRGSGYPNPDGSCMTQAEVILAGLVAQAAGSDLKAKKLLFDLVLKLQAAPVWARDLPEIQLDDEDAAAGAEISPAIEAEGRDPAFRQGIVGTGDPGLSRDDGFIAGVRCGS